MYKRQILNRAYKKMGSPADSTLTSSIKPAWTIILTGLEVAICFAVVTRLSLPTAEVEMCIRDRYTAAPT